MQLLHPKHLGVAPRPRRLSQGIKYRSQMHLSGCLEAAALLPWCQVWGTCESGCIDNESMTGLGHCGLHNTDCVERTTTIQILKYGSADNPFAATLCFSQGDPFGSVSTFKSLGLSAGPDTNLLLQALWPSKKQSITAKLSTTPEGSPQVQQQHMTLLSA